MVGRRQVLRRQDDHRDGPAVLPLAQAGEELEPVHPGHEQVEQDQGRAGGQPVQGLPPVGRLVHRPPLLFEFRPQAACAILSYSVLGRALFHSPNYWQDEAAVFLLVGVAFMTSAYVQDQRGHIGIEAFVGLLSPMANRVRLWLVDVASLLFCAFFAWKSWTLTHEAWVEGQVSNSMWSPPLSIPYGLMAVGMSLLCVQILLQIVIPISAATRR